VHQSKSAHPPRPQRETSDDILRKFPTEGTQAICFYSLYVVFCPAPLALLTRTVNCIGGIKPPKKPGRPATLELNPNFEILSQMRNLSIQFLDNDGQCTFEFHRVLWSVC
jgi:hypothetical protein